MSELDLRKIDKKKIQLTIQLIGDYDYNNDCYNLTGSGMAQVGGRPVVKFKVKEDSSGRLNMKSARAIGKVTGVRWIRDKFNRDVQERISQDERKHI